MTHKLYQQLTCYEELKRYGLFRKYRRSAKYTTFSSTTEVYIKYGSTCQSTYVYILKTKINQNKQTMQKKKMYENKQHIKPV